MRPRKWEYNQYPCDTVQMLGNMKGSRSQRRKISAPGKSWGLAFTCDTYFDALCLSKGKKKKRIYFDNIVQKASTPISKTNGKTSQSKFSNWSASPLELCCRVNSCILSFSLHSCPVSALLASECWGYCWEITANRFENKNDKENDQKRFGDRPHHGLSQESM